MMMPVSISWEYVFAFGCIFLHTSFGRSGQLPAHEEFARAQEALEKSEFESAYRMLMAARQAPDWSSFDRKYQVEGTLGMLLSEHLREPGADEEAVAAFNRALLLKPDYTDIMPLLGIVLMKLEKHKEADNVLRRAMKLVPNQAAEAYSSLQEWTINLYRQDPDPTQRQRAHLAWKRLLQVSNKYDTKVARGIRDWSARVAAPHRQEWRCPNSSYDHWKTKYSEACQSISRREGEELDEVLRRFFLSFGSEGSDIDAFPIPVVVQGWRPEFPNASAFEQALFGCMKKDAVVQAVITHSDGSAVQLQDASLWTNHTIVSSLLEYDEQKVIVRASQQYMKLKHMLSLSGRIPTAVYLAYGNIDVYLPCLRDAIHSPPLLLGRPLAETNAWINSGTTISGLHSDGLHNIHHIVEGHKDIILFPPSHSQGSFEKGIVEVRAVLDDVGQNSQDSLETALRVPHFAEWDGLDNDADEDVCSNAKSADCKLKRRDAIHCKVHAGETLVIPKGWQHNVRSSPDKASCRGSSINLWYEESPIAPRSLLNKEQVDDWIRTTFQLLQRAVGSVGREKLVQSRWDDIADRIPGEIKGQLQKMLFEMLEQEKLELND